MEWDPQIPKYQTSDPTSFAYTSARERWPKILTGAIDDVHRAVSALPDSESTKINEGKSIVAGLAKVKHEVQHNRFLLALPFDGSYDIGDYNAELEARGQITWHETEWLYAECYLYRRIATFFAMSSQWKAHDVFGRQKMSTFKSSRPAVLELAARYREIVSPSTKLPAAEQDADAAARLLFSETATISLWGNATDLSLLTSLTYADIQALQGSSARAAAEANILVNELPAAFSALHSAKRSGKETRRVDIVLDNAGFELFVDLVLAGYLLATGLATQVVLHPKNIPWFVSDVVPADFAALLAALADPKRFYAQSEGEADSDYLPPLSDDEAANVRFLFDDWGAHHTAGRLLLRSNPFWTAAGSFWRMPTLAPEVFADLQQSDLVVWKGDLNYRKLTGDAAWDPTTPFAQALGPLGKPGCGVRSLALRTCKADVVAGLPPGRDEEIRRTEGGGGDSGKRMWAWSGKWAVVQFCDGK